MKLACPVKRPGGSHIELWGKEYHFQEQPDGAHVAEVEDPAHQDRLLAIGYKIYRPGQMQQAEAPAAGKRQWHKPELKDATLLGSSVHPDTFEIGGKTITLGDVVTAAFKRSEMSVDDWNEQAEPDRHAMIDEELDIMAADAEPEGDAGAGNPPAVDPAVDEREELVKQYEAKFGTKPHHKLGVAKLREALEA